MTEGISESVVEEACLEWFRDMGYATVSGSEIAHGVQNEERGSWSDVILVQRLRSAVERLNPSLQQEAIEAVVATIVRPETQSLIAENFRLHRCLTEGITVDSRADGGEVRYSLAWVIDFDHPEQNDWLVVNQMTITELGGKSRRPDAVVFVNGLPLAVLELKNAGGESATVKGAWQQIQTYRHDVPNLFASNVVCVASDGLQARVGSFTAGWEHFAPWKTIDSPQVAVGRPELETLVRGVFHHAQFLDILRHFVLFSDEPSGLIKRIAKYHQFWAVNAAASSAIRAAGPSGDRRGGVIWHTQGSGKSIEMVLLAAKLARSPEMENPTLVFITDRNDLDDQLFGEVFSPARILPENPVQVSSRAELRSVLDRSSGGIVFTTIQKFAPDVAGDAHPRLTERRNVVVIADEAHRSQYDFLDGFARHLRDALPNATYLGFTGTPIESGDRSTGQVFGDYVDVYDLTRAVEDGATVPIYYESRLARVGLVESALDEMDAALAQVTEGQEIDEAERAKSRWSRVEAIVGSSQRLDLVAADIVSHWEARRAGLIGKAMIVCMSRRICVELYERLVTLRPDWHDDDPASGAIKVVMTGSAADPLSFQPHLHSKEIQRSIKARAKDPNDPLEIVIVRDMWLTGFDAPPVHTMYVDKYMQGAGLMQAIARVNRTFRDKPGGLIVDYMGIAHKLREALAAYSPSDQEQAGVPIEKVVDLLREKHDVCSGILHGHPWSADPGLSAGNRLQELAGATNFVLADPDRKRRFLDEALALVKAFALAGARDEAIALRDDVRFFADIRTAVIKLEAADGGARSMSRDGVEVDTAIAQIVSEAVAGRDVVDIYTAAGLARPDVSVLSDEFLDQLATSDKPHLQIAALRRLLEDQVRSVRRTSVVQGRLFSELLEEAINRYTNRALSTAQVIAELVEIAKLMRAAGQRAADLGLSATEVAFYDAVCQNDTAILELGDETLKTIARSLVMTIRNSATIDWAVKESVRAAMRSRIRRLLARYDYPPDKEARAIELILEQAELAARDTDAEWPAS
ncbi:type I restriction endonuclease subunit R [Aquihabitans sp. G128]|uniref:type I restriction endonuclease subunit R n=1 Tax=Aquihabitans sp. G128 TaxID=2849779 RepID=UPI001C21B0D7|nr:type I restriction endonuclease subunit R [Aquihabitans sp. G128]QXC62347.1 type I restriction endonuclease subunit R [Aquihabitans sp. G128]